MGYPIAIVGAGIGGLSCALAFQRLGYDVRVFEQADVLAEVGAGIGLWPGAIKALTEMDITPEFWQLRKCPFREAETAAPDGRSLVRFDVSGLTADAPGFVLRRSDLHKALSDSVAPGTVTLGAVVTGVTQSADEATVTFSDGSQFSTGVVIGADGLRSAVRTTLFGDRAPRYSGETCYRGMATLSVTDTGMLREVQGRGLRCAVHPVDADHVYWWAARRSPAGIVEGPDERKEILQRLYAGWRGGFPEALELTPASAILKNDLFDRPPLAAWSVGRIALLGDAAHPTTPNLGLGGCMAIEDSLVLARAFAENDDDHTRAFAQYQAERQARTRRVVRTSAMFGRLGSFTNPAAIRVRETLMRATPTSLMRDSFAREVGYEPGPLRRRTDHRA